MSLGTRIHIEHVYPPVPFRNHDWRATFDGYEPGDPMGAGSTKEEAIGDLLDQAYDEEDV